MNESNVATTGGTLRRTLAMTHTQFTKNSYACLSPVGERGEGAVGGTAAPTLRMSENQNAQNKFKAKKLTLTE